MFIDKMVPTKTTLEGPSLLVFYHLVVPVGEHFPAKSSLQLNNPNAKIRVVDVQIVGHTPHDYQVSIQVLQFPSNGARGAGETGVTVVHCYHHFSVGGEHFSLMEG